MNLKTKRNICGTVAVVAIASIAVQPLRLAWGCDIEGWELASQGLAVLVFGAFWLKYRHLYRDEQFYRRYRDNYDP